MTHVDKLIEKFGGLRQMADAIEYPLTTVQAWRDRKSIHDKHKPVIMDRAHKAGVLLTPDDFFPVSPEPFSTADR